jgi:hypothetical protein
MRTDLVWVRNISDVVYTRFAGNENVCRIAEGTEHDALEAVLVDLVEEVESSDQVFREALIDSAGEGFDFTQVGPKEDQRKPEEDAYHFREIDLRRWKGGESKDRFLQIILESDCDFERPRVLPDIETQEG